MYAKSRRESNSTTQGMQRVGRCSRAQSNERLNETHTSVVSGGDAGGGIVLADGAVLARGVAARLDLDPPVGVAYGQLQTLVHLPRRARELQEAGKYICAQEDEYSCAY